jgi:pyruvate dehydrogenase E2 component (dihydrolipoamide acetyltransferase)
MSDRRERLPMAERWLADAFEVFSLPAGFILEEVDMSRVREAKAAWQARGVRVTYTAMAVRAAALALSRLPDVHVLLAGSTRVRPATVDVGVSVAATTNFAPVVVLRGADRKGVADLSLELERLAKEARDGERKALADLGKVAWLVPWRWLRKAILRLLFGSLWFRRKLVGTFQVSTLPVDGATVFQFMTSAVLGVGRIKDRVVAVNGAPTVRPTSLFTMTIDHRALDGAKAARLLAQIREILEGAHELEPPESSTPDELQPPAV